MTEHMPAALQKPGERIDDLQRNGLRILQHRKRFCFGMDAVLLSGFAHVKAGEDCLDLGTGTGILPLLLSAKTKARRLVGLEIQPESADMARRSVALNGLEEKIEIREGDLKEASALFGRAAFDVVCCNPPYLACGHGLTGPVDAKAVARHEILCSFEDVARESSLVLKSGGRLFLVHRPFRLTELFVTLTRFRLEPKRMRFVHPYAHKEPNMVLLECVKGGRRMLTVEAPLVIFEAPGKYTEEVAREYNF